MNTIKTRPLSVTEKLKRQKALKVVDANNAAELARGSTERPNGTAIALQINYDSRGGLLATVVKNNVGTDMTAEIISAVSAALDIPPSESVDKKRPSRMQIEAFIAKKTSQLTTSLCMKSKRRPTI